MSRKYSEIKHTSLHDISPEQMNKLNELAVKVLGKRSVSALVRFIADYGRTIVNLDNDGEPYSITLSASRVYEE